LLKELRFDSPHCGRRRISSVIMGAVRCQTCPLHLSLALGHGMLIFWFCASSNDVFFDFWHVFSKCASSPCWHQESQETTVTSHYTTLYTVMQGACIFIYLFLLFSRGPSMGISREEVLTLESARFFTHDYYLKRQNCHPPDGDHMRAAFLHPTQCAACSSHNRHSVERPVKLSPALRKHIKNNSRRLTCQSGGSTRTPHLGDFVDFKCSE
jgi:hypothetical protein